MIGDVRFSEHTSRNQLQSWLAWRQKWMLGGSYMDRIPVDRFGKFSFSLSPYPGSVFRRRIQLSSMVMRKLAMSPLSRSTIACSIMVNLASRSKLWSGNRKCSSDVIGSFLHLTSDRWPLILLSSCVWVFPMYCRLQYIYIYSKTRLQIIRWNKSREASTENEEKQTGLNIGKITTWYDRSLTTIILYSMTGLSHRHIWQNKKDK